MGIVPRCVNCDRRWSVERRAFHCVNIASDILVIATAPLLYPDLGWVTGEDVQLQCLVGYFSLARLAVKVVAYDVGATGIRVFFGRCVDRQSAMSLLFNGQLYG
jgi:hypothetical protein